MKAYQCDAIHPSLAGVAKVAAALAPFLKPVEKSRMPKKWKKRFKNGDLERRTHKRYPRGYKILSTKAGRRYEKAASIWGHYFDRRGIFIDKVYNEHPAKRLHDCVFRKNEYFRIMLGKADAKKDRLRESLTRKEFLGAYPNNRGESTAEAQMESKRNWLVTFHAMEAVGAKASPFCLAGIRGAVVRRAEDGELCFWWRFDGVTVDVSFFENEDTYTYYARLPDGREFVADEIPLGTPLPDEIDGALRIFSYDRKQEFF